MKQQNSETVIPASQRLRDQFSFTRVPNEIIEHPRLSMQAKMIWIELWKFCYREGDSAFPGMAKIAQELNTSEDTIRRHRRQLEEEGLLVVKRRGLTKTNLYFLYVPEPEQSPAPEPAEFGVQGPVNLPDKEDEVIRKRSNKKNNTADDGLTRSESDVNQTLNEQEKVLSSFSSLADQIIDYLNEKAGARYRHSKASRKYIIARLKEGATVEDCRLVIDHKVGKWLHDPEMSEYLRPSTLFRPSHFEEYLAAAIRWHEQGRPRSEKEQEARNKALAALGRKLMKEDGDYAVISRDDPVRRKRPKLPPMRPEERMIINEAFGGI